MKKVLLTGAGGNLGKALRNIGGLGGEHSFD